MNPRARLYTGKKNPFRTLKNWRTQRVIAVVAGVLIGLMVGLAGGMKEGLMYGLIAELIYGSVYGLVFAATYRYLRRREPSPWTSRELAQ